MKSAAMARAMWRAAAKDPNRVNNLRVHAKRKFYVCQSMRRYATKQLRGK